MYMPELSTKNDACVFRHWTKDRWETCAPLASSIGLAFTVQDGILRPMVTMMDVTPVGQERTQGGEHLYDDLHNAQCIPDGSPKAILLSFVFQTTTQAHINLEPCCIRIRRSD